MKKLVIVNLENCLKNKNVSFTFLCEIEKRINNEEMILKIEIPKSSSYFQLESINFIPFDGTYCVYKYCSVKHVI